VTASAAFSSGMFAISAISAADFRAYRDGVQTGATQAGGRGSGALFSSTHMIFGYLDNGTPSQYSSATIKAYSLGLGLTSTQCAALNTALVAFQTALGRN
jgi:hypothetical protein